MNWRLIPSSFIPQNGQMAYDEECYQGFEEGHSPLIRFFSFSSPTLTLGRLEARRIKLDQLPYPYEIRPTGGRAVFHGKNDLCYSIVASQKDPQVGGDLITSYQKISRLLAQGLASLGREVTLTQAKHLGLGDPHCFSAPSLAELTFQGKKVAGGAQARRGDIFLQQGVLLLSVAEEWKKAFPGAGLDNMRGLNDENSLPAVTGEQLEKKLTEAFESNGVHFEKVLTPALPSLKL